MKKLVFCVTLAAVGLALPPGIHAGPNAVVGISDPAYQTNWKTMWPKMEPLHLDQVAVWVHYDCNAPNDVSLNKVPATMPVFVNFVGDPVCTPKTRRARQQYVQALFNLVWSNHNIKEVKVWNEPDIRNWSWYGTMMQYIKLQAAVYDRLQGRVIVLGGGFSPKGMSANRRSKRVQMSLPGYAKLVRRYYRRTGRQRPLMDGFAYNPYWGWNKASTDRVVRILNRYWNGLPQRSPRRGLRFWWAETGLDSACDGAPTGPYGQTLYKGKYFAWRNSGSDAQQAQKAKLVLRRALLDSRVAAVFNFLLEDEQDLSRWQSGLFYFMGGPKPAYYVWLNRKELVPQRAFFVRARARIKFGGE